MKVVYCPTETMIADLYMKPLQGRLFRLFRNLIFNLREEDISNMENLEELTKMENKIGSIDRVQLVESDQECVVGNNKVRILSTGKYGVVSDATHNTVDGISDMNDIIARTEPDLLS